MQFKNHFLVLIFLVLASAFASAANSNIDIEIAQSEYYINTSGNLTLQFNFKNFYDGADDGVIDQVDLYFLDLSEQKVSINTFSGSGWQHEFITAFNDDHFWVQNAASQQLTVQIKINQQAEGSYNLTGYFQFYDDEGLVTGLGDNRPLYPLVDNVDHYFAKIIIDSTNPKVEFEGEPEWTFQGLKLKAKITDSSPINSAAISYNAKTGQKTLDLNAGNNITALIPSSDITEGTALNYTLTATDKAGNSGSASSTFTAIDIPLISNAHPSTILPGVELSFLATITDTSGIASATFNYSVNGIKQPSKQLSLNIQGTYSAVLGSFEEAANITYVIEASDTLGNKNSLSGNFKILSNYALNFEVLDFYTRQPVSNVTLKVNSKTLLLYGAQVIVPEKTFNFNGRISFTHPEGTFLFNFTHPSYAKQTFSFKIESDFNKTILFGGAISEIKSAEIIPRLSDDNAAFYLDVFATIAENVPLKQVFWVYSIDNDALNKQVELFKNSEGLYFGSLGPFTGQITLYSQIQALDIQSQVVIKDLGIRWYSLLGVAGARTVSFEICGNLIDDNDNGTIDEGCACNEGASLKCGKNVGACKQGIQKCIQEVWAFCEGSINPITEICDNNVDDDCDGRIDNGCNLDSDLDLLTDKEELQLSFTDPENPDTDEDNVSDGQEFLYDGTNALDANSNLLFLDLKPVVGLFEQQEISIKHPSLGAIPNIKAVVLTPSGTELSFESDEKGIIKFAVLESGVFGVRAWKKKFSAVKNFNSKTELFSIPGLINISIAYIFGETAVEFPLAFIFVIMLCIIIGVLFYDQMPYYFKKKIISSQSERANFLLKVALTLVVAAFPLAFFKFYSIELSVFVAFAEIILIFVSAFALRQAFARKGIKVEVEKPTMIDSIFEKAKSVLIEKQEKKPVETAKKWKKVEWKLETPKPIPAPTASTSSKQKIIDGTLTAIQQKEKEFKQEFPEVSEPMPSRSAAGQALEVWKRFEPIEFEDRMKEIGKQVERTLERKLLEVGEEIERRIGRRLSEVEEDVDRRVGRRLLESEEAVDRRLGRKLTEAEEDLEKKLSKKVKELEEEIQELVEKKLETRRKTSRIIKVHLPKGKKPKPSYILPSSKLEEKTIALKVSKIKKQLNLLQKARMQNLISKEAFEKDTARLKEMLKKIAG